jgi:hypothetical protein
MTEKRQRQNGTPSGTPIYGGWCINVARVFVACVAPMLRSSRTLQPLWGAGPLAAAVDTLLHTILALPALCEGNGPKAFDTALARPASSKLSGSHDDDVLVEIPWKVHVGQAGVPKKKKSVYQRQRMHMGIHFKHRFLRYQAWYFCPLCAEPKQQGTCCRREDCRQMKP